MFSTKYDYFYDFERWVYIYKIIYKKFKDSLKEYVFIYSLPVVMKTCSGFIHEYFIVNWNKKIMIFLPQSMVFMNFSGKRWISLKWKHFTCQCPKYSTTKYETSVPENYIIYCIVFLAFFYICNGQATPGGASILGGWGETLPRIFGVRWTNIWLSPQV